MANQNNVLNKIQPQASITDAGPTTTRQLGIRARLGYPDLATFTYAVDQQGWWNVSPVSRKLKL
jgi:hypothetical protein